MKIYLVCYEDEDDPMEKEVWVIRRSPPDIAYVELEVRVVRREPAFSRDRKKTKKLFGFLKRSS